VPPTLADRLVHILDAIFSIEALLADKTQGDLAKSRHLRMILERELELISEASRRIPDDVKAAEIGIDWSAMATLGNLLRHAYHRADLAIVFSIVNDDLPSLKAFVERVLDAGKKR
jgi:uncharacterized protein with HEPN domain